MVLTKEQIQVVIDYLEGTCETLDKVIFDTLGIEEEHIENDSEFYELLDSQIYNCPCCGWWVEAGASQYSENEGEEVCENCIGD